MHGMGIMIVMAVGRNSFYGHLLSKIHEDHVDSPLKLKISDLSNSINENSMVVGLLTFFSLLFHYLYQCSQED
jgi:magnesium-transporting ATPase (P-type)